MLATTAQFSSIIPFLLDTYWWSMTIKCFPLTDGRYEISILYFLLFEILLCNFYRKLILYLITIFRALLLCSENYSRFRKFEMIHASWSLKFQPLRHLEYFNDKITSFHYSRKQYFLKSETLFPDPSCRGRKSKFHRPRFL